MPTPEPNITLETLGGDTEDAIAAIGRACESAAIAFESEIQPQRKGDAEEQERTTHDIGNAVEGFRAGFGAGAVSVLDAVLNAFGGEQAAEIAKLIGGDHTFAAHLDLAATGLAKPTPPPPDVFLRTAADILWEVSDELGIAMVADYLCSLAHLSKGSS